jgi:hypothetical protein
MQWWAFLVLGQSAEAEGARAIQSLKTLKRSWARPSEEALCGLAYLAAGSTTRSGPFAAELKGCVDGCLRGPIDETNENWHLGFQLFFLSMVHRKDPAPEVKARIGAIVRRLSETQAASGGWSHKKGFVYPVQGRNISDIAMVGAIVAAGLAAARSCGIEVPQGTLDRAWGYFGRMADGPGLRYGTDNPAPDPACSRGAWVLVALHLLGRKDERYGSIARGVRERMKNLEQAHSLPALHYLSTGLASWASGSWPEWKARWMAKLLASRGKDGAVWIKFGGAENFEGRTIKSNLLSTAALALLCHLEKGHLIPKPK